MWVQGMAGWELSIAVGTAFTASPISTSRIRPASNTRPSDRSPRCRWERMASIAAWMSASRCRSRYVTRSQGHEVALGAGADGGLEIAGWHQVNLGSEDGLQVGLEPTQAEQAHMRWQVREQVDVAVGPVLATGHAAEDPQVGHLMGGGGRDQAPPGRPDLPPYPAGQAGQLRRVLRASDPQAG